VLAIADDCIAEAALLYIRGFFRRELCARLAAEEDPLIQHVA